MTGRPLGSGAERRRRSEAQTYSESGFVQALQSTPSWPWIVGSGVGGSRRFGRKSPSKGHDSHS